MAGPVDDVNFSSSAAASWISLIESDAARRRVDTLYPRLNAWLEGTSASDVLDIGCGQGICGHFLALNGRHYHGIDASSALIDRATHLYADTHRQFTVANVYELPFAAASFGAAFSVSLWHLLADLATATSEVFRVLESGGHLLVIAANPDAYANWTAPYCDVVTDGHRLEGSVRSAVGTIERDTIYLRPLSMIMGNMAQGLYDWSDRHVAPQKDGEPGMFSAITAYKP